MASVILEYAICKWQDRVSAQYFPTNNIHSYEDENGRKVNTVFDAYGRQLGDPNFNYPRPPTEEELLEDEDIKYFRFNSDDEHEIIVYRMTGYKSTQYQEKEIVVDGEIDGTSANPIQNKAVYEALQTRATKDLATIESPGLMSAQDKSKLEGLTEGYLGYYATSEALLQAHPNGQNGQFASIGATDTIWAWDSDSNKWVNTDTNTINPSWNNITGKPDFALVATSGSYDDLEDKPNLSAVATSGSYDDLTNKPSLKTVATSGKYSDLEGTPNLSLVATSGNYSDLNGKPDLKTVATSGSYNDLIDKPNLKTVATSGSYDDLLNKPQLKTVATSGKYSDLEGTPNLSNVATSGSYGDLINKPDLKTVAISGNYSDLNGKPNLKPVATSGSYNDLANKPTIPAVDSALNDSSTNAIQNKVVALALAGKASTDVATTETNGLMSSQDKSKLNELSNYSLPIASTNTLGGVKVDDKTIKINNGVITAEETYLRKIISSSTTLENREWAICTANCTLTLPSATVGAYIKVSTADGVDNVLISPASGENIDGDADGIRIDLERGSVEFYGTATGWKVSDVGGSSEIAIQALETDMLGKAGVGLDNLTSAGKSKIVDTAFELDWLSAIAVPAWNTMYQAERDGILTVNGISGTDGNSELWAVCNYTSGGSNNIAYESGLSLTDAMAGRGHNHWVIVPKGSYYYAQMVNTTNASAYFIPFKNSIANN